MVVGSMVSLVLIGTLYSVDWGPTTQGLRNRGPGTRRSDLAPCCIGAMFCPGCCSLLTLTYTSLSLVIGLSKQLEHCSLVRRDGEVGRSHACLDDLDSQSDMSEGDSDETHAPEVIDLTWSDASVGSDSFESKKLTRTDSSDDEFESKKPR